MTKDIFISYRRDGAEALAHLLYNRLTADGYEVFLDVESLRSGKFNEALIKKIQESTDFILLLPPGGLNRCSDKEDWVRREIEAAFQLKKNIIPVMMRGFTFPETLPESIKELRNFNGIEANMEYFDAVISRLETMRLQSVPRNPKRKHEAKIVRCPVCHSENISALDEKKISAMLLDAYQKVFNKLSELSFFPVCALLVLWAVSRLEKGSQLILQFSASVPFLRDWITVESLTRMPKLAGQIFIVTCLLMTAGIILNKIRAKTFRKLSEAGERNVSHTCLECHHEFELPYSLDELAALKDTEKDNPMAVIFATLSVIAAIAIIFLLWKFVLGTLGIILAAMTIAAIIIADKLSNKKKT